MVGNSGALAAVLTVVSVLSLSLLSFFCLRCKRKSKVIHEEHQIYNPQTFQRGGSLFAVTQSKTVIRPNQRNETCENFSAEPSDEQSDYENVIKNSAAASETGSLEHTYVDPLPISVYVNEERIIDAEQSPGVYGNITTADDDDDYENATYLQEMQEQQEEEEPDYVNENGES